MPRSRSGSVSEHFSLQTLRPLFFAAPTLERPLPPCTLRRDQSPWAVCSVLGLPAPMGPVLFPMSWGGQLEGKHSRSIPVSSGKGLPTTARVCAGLAGWRMPNSLTAYGVLGTNFRGWSCFREEVCSRSQSEWVSAGLCTLFPLAVVKEYFFFFLPDWTKFLLYQWNFQVVSYFEEF